MGMKRTTIPYFDGVNSLVEHNISKKTEPEQAENARSVKIGSLEKRKGYSVIGNDISAVANYGLFYFESALSSKYLWQASRVGAVTNLYYLSNSSVWTILAGFGANLSNVNVETAIAENNLFFVNGTDTNRYINGSDGITVTDSTTVLGHLYGSPKAFKINYYKDRLYLGDYLVGTNRYKNGMMMSSKPLGIVALVDGDITAGTDQVTVTDTKYIYTASDQLDVYRGGTLITTLTITAKKEYSVTVSGTTSVTLQSADELWVKNTYTTSPRVFRWATNPATGTSVKRYDTFKLGGGANSSLNMMTNIGDIMAISNKDCFMTWNDSALTNYDSEIGCVSPRGFIKSNNILFFVNYSGVYATTGGAPKLVSSKVQAYFDGATTAGLEASSAGAKGTSVFFSIGSVTLYNNDGSVNKTLANVCLEYNMRQENWFVHTNIPASKFSKYISAGPSEVAFTNNSNFKIYNFLNGQDDAGSEIPFALLFENIGLLSEFEKFVYVHKLIIEVEAGNNGQVFVSVDGGEFYQLKDSINKGVNIITVNPRTPASENDLVRCKKISVAIKEFSKGSFKVSRFAIVYADSLETEEHSK